MGSRRRLDVVFPVYDFTTGQFEVNLGAVVDYLNNNNYYVAAITGDYDVWWMDLYNWETEQWEEFDSVEDAYGPRWDGWDIWEEYDLNEDPWPDLGKTFRSKHLQICDASGWHYVTDDDAIPYPDIPDCSYDYGWIEEYWHWYFDTDL